MKLYSVRYGKLVEGEVIRESKHFYFFANSDVPGWSTRLDKTPAGLRHCGVATTPQGAWEIEQLEAREQEIRLWLAAEQNVGRLQTAQRALDAIRVEVR